MTDAEVTAIAIKWSNSKFVARSDRFVQDFAREILAAAKVEAAQPDCRTCDYFVKFEGCTRNSKFGVCTNGDKYSEAPAVVLWRNEL